ncbi:hypothetical protein FA15DRAFT_653288 [Coprinopsis marcescibilis]|uniref:Uncharacterized protein n=1 Tax=Coprinopsis marcescibilis TaxID=230819 RepID=A0A5C3L425_COPMA|nr:hypothetical protein FA15DRAFT_653288 [Coprinopsis marcescibilis]
MLGPSAAVKTLDLEALSPPHSIAEGSAHAAAPYQMGSGDSASRIDTRVIGSQLVYVRTSRDAYVLSRAGTALRYGHSRKTNAPRVWFQAVDRMNGRGLMIVCYSILGAPAFVKVPILSKVGVQPERTVTERHTMLRMIREHKWASNRHPPENDFEWRPLGKVEVHLWGVRGWRLPLTCRRGLEFCIENRGWNSCECGVQREGVAVRVGLPMWLAMDNSMCVYVDMEYTDPGVHIPRYWDDADEDIHWHPIPSASPITLSSIHCVERRWAKRPLLIFGAE